MSILTHEAPKSYDRRTFLRVTPLTFLAGLFALPTQAKPGLDPRRLAEMIEDARETARDFLAEFRPSCLAELEAELVGRYVGQGSLRIIGCAPDEPVILASEPGPVIPTIFLPDVPYLPEWRTRIILGMIALMLETEPPQLSLTLSPWDVASAQAKLRPVSEAFLDELEEAGLQ